MSAAGPVASPEAPEDVRTDPGDAGGNPDVAIEERKTALRLGLPWTRRPPSVRRASLTEEALEQLAPGGGACCGPAGVDATEQALPRRHCERCREPPRQAAVYDPAQWRGLRESAAQRHRSRGRGARGRGRVPGPRWRADEGLRELRVSGAALVLHAEGGLPDAARCGGGLRGGRPPSDELRDARGASPAAGAPELRSTADALNEMRRPPSQMWRAPRFRQAHGRWPWGLRQGGSGEMDASPAPMSSGGPGRGRRWRRVEPGRCSRGAVRRRVGQAVRRSIVMSREIKRSASAAVAV